MGSPVVVTSWRNDFQGVMDEIIGLGVPDGLLVSEITVRGHLVGEQ